MPVVSNTSPLLNLAIIDQLNLLPQQFDQVYIPIAVVEELRLDTSLPGVRRIKQGMESGWLVLRDLSDQNIATALERDLDHGEAQAIALALQLGQPIVLVDEHEGRSIAKTMALRPVGVLGILLWAKVLGHISEIKPNLLALQQEAGFYITDKLFTSIMKEAGEA